MEHILRRVVGDLEARKAALEALVDNEERDLKALRCEVRNNSHILDCKIYMTQSERLQRENEAMAAKMERARSHLINAGVFDDYYSAVESEAQNL